jgi:alkylation response protein AidB-like acyl-CoA dehydrogenase
MTADLDDFRATVRQWCRAHVPADWRTAQTGASDEEFVAFQQAWFAELHRVVGKAMQLHGGIGYTWESGIHVYLKRAALNRSLFGSPAAHRKQLAERYENWRQ